MSRLPRTRDSLRRAPSGAARPFAEPPAADRIAIVRLGAVGDVVRTLPAASRLRAAYPGAHLTWLVEAPSAGLLRAQSWLDAVVEVPRDRFAGLARGGRWVALGREAARFAASLRGLRFDLVVDFHSILRSALVSAATRAPLRVAYARPAGRELAYRFATHAAPLARGPLSRFERNAALVDFLGVGAPPLAQPLEVPPAARVRMREALASTGAGAPIALHPGTSDATAHKRYPAPLFGALAREVRDRTGRASIVTCGPGRDDRALAERVVAESAGCARLAPPTPELTDLAALLSLCGALVAGDSGPLHAASLVGTPVVQVLGPTHPVENAPYTATPSRTLRSATGCSPCRRGCAPATCMRLVAPGDVAAAVVDLLGIAAPAKPAVAAGS